VIEVVKNSVVPTTVVEVQQPVIEVDHQLIQEELPKDNIIQKPKEIGGEKLQE
jgi:hypothetical protein